MLWYTVYKEVPMLSVRDILPLYEMGRGKIKIAVDENIKGVIPHLEEKGYNVFTPEEGLNDDKIHKWLQEENVKAFFTKNWRHFEDFDDRNYILYSVKINRPDYIMVDVIECVMMKDFKMTYKLKKSKPTYHLNSLRVLSNHSLKKIGCKM